MNARSDRSLRDAENPAGLGDRKAPVVMQREHHPILLVESGEGTLEAPQLNLTIERIGRRWSFEVKFDKPAPMLDEPQGGSHHDPAEPGREPIGVAKLRQ